MARTEKRKKKKMPIIELVAGDWSGDGHCKKETFVIESNLGARLVQRAFALGSFKLGFDLTRDVAERYNHSMSDEKVAKLKEAGFDGDIDFKWLTAENFKEMYLFIAKLGNPQFRYKFPVKSNSTICIGGYGLFD
jgi:hypothetical protein